MSQVQKNFDSYNFLYFGGTSLQDGQPGAIIDCYDGATYVASLSFFRDGVIIPANQVLASGILALYYEMSRYNDVITTLRYEKPLKVAVDSDNATGYLGSALGETVGEQEGV